MSLTHFSSPEPHHFSFSLLQQLLLLASSSPCNKRQSQNMMGCFGGKKKSNKNQYENSLRYLTSKLKLLEEEMRAIKNEREEESKAYERGMLVYAFREAEWKQERKKLKEEVKRLKEAAEEIEEKIREMEVMHVGFGQVRDDKEKHVIEKDCCWCDQILTVESNVREGRGWWRDEAVYKWKKLYLAIKTELDDLIQRTHGHGGDALSWRAEEEEIIEELKMEVTEKDEAIEELKERLRVAEQEAKNNEREIDILRQSLRIISSSKKTSSFSLTKPKLPISKKIIT